LDHSAGVGRIVIGEGLTFVRGRFHVGACHALRVKKNTPKGWLVAIIPDREEFGREIQKPRFG
jgi:hypothetical protein